MFGSVKNIHFVGIGGIGMSGIAKVLFNLGFSITGSDIYESETVVELENMGIKVFIGHKKENVRTAHVVVYSSAVKSDNPEIMQARKQDIPVIRRAEMLGELMRFKYSIAVSGTHGKTTTTSIVSHMLKKTGFDPTSIIGGKITNGSNAGIGKGDYLVAEADESDKSFLKLYASSIIVTNIDADHLDFYRDLTAIKKAFLEFIEKLPFYGVAILCYDSDGVKDIIPFIRQRKITYGITGGDIVAYNIEKIPWGHRFNVKYKEKELGSFVLNVPGIHNIVNTLAAIGIGLELAIPIEAMKSSIQSFPGVSRRLEIMGKTRDILIINDYGHHPTEIKSVLSTLNEEFPDRRKVVLFQPHRYTRTHFLLEKFGISFTGADYVVITDIYSAGEAPIPGVSGGDVARKVLETLDVDVEYLYGLDKENIAHRLKNILKQGDILIILGAGDIWKTGKRLLEIL